MQTHLFQVWREWVWIVGVNIDNMPITIVIMVITIVIVVIQVTDFYGYSDKNSNCNYSSDYDFYGYSDKITLLI